MSKLRKLLLAAGILAVPAAAFAATSTPSDCCAEGRGCCAPAAACCEAQATPQIVCPLDGRTIDQDDCPLCKSAK